MELQLLEWVLEQGGLAAIAIVSIMVIKFIHKERVTDLKDNAVRHSEVLEKTNSLANRAFDAIDRNSTVMQELSSEIRKLYDFHFSQMGELIYSYKIREKELREGKQ